MPDTTISFSTDVIRSISPELPERKMGQQISLRSDSEFIAQLGPPENRVVEKVLSRVVSLVNTIASINPLTLETNIAACTSDYNLVRTDAQLSRAFRNANMADPRLNIRKLSRYKLLQEDLASKLGSYASGHNLMELGERYEEVTPLSLTTAESAAATILASMNKEGVHLDHRIGFVNYEIELTLDAENKFPLTDREALALWRAGGAMAYAIDVMARLHVEGGKKVKPGNGENLITSLDFVMSGTVQPVVEFASTLARVSF